MNDIDEKKLKISSKKFRVNETAEFLGITPRILKHYEKTGVLTPERSEGNDYRAYTAEDIIKIQVSEQLKAVGFTNREICDYFSGALDIRATHEKLIAIREKIDHFLSVLGYDLQPNKPRFSIAEENTLLCYVERRPTRSDLLQRYYDARNAYCNAVDAGCRCDNMRMFFFIFDRENPYQTFCEICGGSRHLVVHHIDGNRKNNAPENLVKICRSCHAQVHGLTRNFGGKES